VIIPHANFFNQYRPFFFLSFFFFFEDSDEDDGSFSSIWNHIGIGISLHDDDAYKLAKTMSFSSIYPVEVGEALGLFHALQ